MKQAGVIYPDNSTQFESILEKVAEDTANLLVKLEESERIEFLRELSARHLLRLLPLFLKRSDRVTADIIEKIISDRKIIF